MICLLLWSGLLYFVKSNGDDFLKMKRGLTLVLVYYLGGMLSAYLENSNEGKNEPNDK